MRHPDPPGSDVQATWRHARPTNPVRLGRVDSTNRYLADAARAGAPDGLAVLADEQDAGRGRRGRTWSAPPGSSLLCSILFRPALAWEAVHLTATLVGLAGLDAARGVGGVEASLKWPNDVLVGERKLAGVLAEVVPGPAGEAPGADAGVGGWPAVVVGIGMNVAWPPGWPPPGPLGELTESATTLEREAGRPVDRDAVAAALLASVERRRPELATAAGRGRIAAEYRAACSTIGRRVRVELGGSGGGGAPTQLEGLAVDVGDDGRLVLETADGARRSLEVGDIVHLRWAGGRD